MVFRLKFWRAAQLCGELVGKLDGSDQDIRIDALVVEHFLKWQQRGSHATEAGGQIFGLVSTNRVEVKMATGPYPRDKRERYNYRSDPVAAQNAIDTLARRGLLYVGEWHTHAEDVASASLSDLDAMNTLRARSKTCTSALLLLIVGRSAPPAGVSIYSIDGKRRLVRWGMDQNQSLG